MRAVTGDHSIHALRCTKIPGRPPVRSASAAPCVSRCAKSSSTSASSDYVPASSLSKAVRVSKCPGLDPHEGVLALVSAIFPFTGYGV